MSRDIFHSQGTGKDGLPRRKLQFLIRTSTPCGHCCSTWRRLDPPQSSLQLESPDAQDMQDLVFGCFSDSLSLSPRRPLRSVVQMCNATAQHYYSMVRGIQNLTVWNLGSDLVGNRLRNFWREGFKIAGRFQCKAHRIVGFLIAQRLQSSKFSKDILTLLSTNENICRTTSEGGRKVPCMQKLADKDSFFILSNGKSQSTGLWSPTEWKVSDAMRSVFVKIFRFGSPALTPVFYTVQEEDKTGSSSFHHLRALDTSWIIPVPFFITCMNSHKNFYKETVQLIVFFVETYLWSTILWQLFECGERYLSHLQYKKIEFWEKSFSIQAPKHLKCHLSIIYLAFIRRFARLTCVLNVFFIIILNWWGKMFFKLKKNYDFFFM